MDSSKDILSDRYQDHGNGTVSDHATGLMWKKCSEGQVWNNQTCIGSATEMTLGQAMWAHRTIVQRLLGVKQKPRVWPVFAGYDDWRLPTVKELHSIVLEDTQNLCVNTKIFPNTPQLWFWTMPTDTYDLKHARLVSFCGSYVDGSHKDRHHAVRLVRTES
jgi:hypothetical protein